MQTRWNLKVWLPACLAGAMFAGGQSLALAQQEDAAQNQARNQTEEDQSQDSQEQQSDSQQKAQSQEDEPTQTEQERQAGEEARTEGSTKMGQFEGIVDEELRITIDDETQRFRTNEQTQVTINGQRSQLEELDAGDTMRVQVGPEGIVQSITAMRGPNATTQARQQAQRGQSRPGQAGQQQRGEQQAQGRGTRQGQNPVTLGVRLAPSPTTGVLVRDLQPQGPAERAGLQTGDYIIRIDDQKIDDIEAFDQALSQAQPGGQLQLTVWRDNQEEQVTITLPEQRQLAFRPEDGAPQGDRRQQFDSQNRRQTQNQGRGQFEDRQGRQGRQGQQGWLGVLLDDSELDDQQGVRIVNIYPSGPASRAGLRQGDVIVEVNSQDIQSAQDAVTVISSAQPNEQLEMVILRDGQRETMSIVLADRRDFFGPGGSQFGQFDDDMDEQRGFRDGSGMIPEHAMMLEQHRRFAEQHQRIEERLEQVLQELEELRRQLGQGGPGGPGAGPRTVNPEQPNRPQPGQDTPETQPESPEQPEPGTN